METKEYSQNRFEFAIYVNDNVICKRNFKINFFNEAAFYSLEMKHQLDNIVRKIQDDLTSKSRLYTWYYYDPQYTDDEFSSPLIPEWECTFKIVITDNGEEVLSKIWDGYCYPKAIREKVDLTNKFIEINNTKVEISKTDPSRLPIEAYINRIIMNNRQDIVTAIIKMICEVASPEKVTVDEKVIKEGKFCSDNDYTLSEIYNNDSKNIPSKKYLFGKNQRMMKLASDWGNAVAAKTKQYFDVECNGFFNKK